MPDLTFDTLDTVPEGLREVAKENNGKFVVSVVPAAKLNEFRDNNVAISKERDALKVVAESIKPLMAENETVEQFITRFGTLRDIEQQVKDGKLTAKGDIEAEVGRRVSEMKTGFERTNSEQAKALAAAIAERDAATHRWRQGIVERFVTEAVVADGSGALPSALPDILNRAAGVFSVGEDGKLTAKDGEAIMYGADGTSPMTPKEWLAKLKDQAPHFFKASSGGGASGGGGSAQYGGMSQADFNALPPAEKMRIFRESAGKR